MNHDTLERTGIALKLAAGNRLDLLESNWAEDLLFGQFHIRATEGTSAYKAQKHFNLST